MNRQHVIKILLNIILSQVDIGNYFLILVGKELKFSCFPKGYRRFVVRGKIEPTSLVPSALIGQPSSE